MKPLLLPFLLAPALLIADENSAPATAQDAAEMIAALERKVLYHPRKYGKGVMEKFTAGGGRRMDYTATEGKQTAWILPPREGATPEKLWVVCGGNGTLALEMAPLCRSLPFARDAWLLVDYPGYGECAGSPDPQGIRGNLKTAITAAAAQFKMEKARLPQQVCVFGHSLGCAAALLAVEEFKLHAAVLIAPFTSTPDMASQQFHIPQGLKLQHIFDNRTGLGVLQENKGRAWIFHGEADNVIPVTMSRTLETEFKDTVQLQTFPGAGHGDIFRRAAKEMTSAMTSARQQP